MDKPSFNLSIVYYKVYKPLLHYESSIAYFIDNLSYNTSAKCNFSFLKITIETIRRSVVTEKKYNVHIGFSQNHL